RFGRVDPEGTVTAVGKEKQACVIARLLDHLRTRGGKSPQRGLGMLVGAVLAPQGGEHAQLREGRRAAEHRLDAAVLCGGEIVVADQRGRDRRVARERRRRRHGSGSFAPETPRITMRNTRVIMLGDGCASRLSASPLSNQIPWQWVHWSI